METFNKKEQICIFTLMVKLFSLNLFKCQLDWKCLKYAQVLLTIETFAEFEPSTDTVADVREYSGRGGEVSPKNKKKGK